MFSQARAVNGGCVLFFNEIDSMCRTRNDAEDETSQVRNEFLKQLDACVPGANEKSNVIVIAATNRPCTDSSYECSSYSSCARSGR